eukprot:TRINITY_DN23230_c0_g1_i1.p2 TRINITY_DN23230_c0_g1~~TRINITY_DN23230_c0_g1_i1.p2  ORF type:complete len:170 (+),score=47.92 TRINITY_DN23230_c0_g1_i1:65-574(+)
MARPLARLPRMARFRLAPARDDLRDRVARDRLVWQPEVTEMDRVADEADDEVYAELGAGDARTLRAAALAAQEAAAAEAEAAAASSGSGSYARVGASAAPYEEAYGRMARNKWRSRFWDRGGTGLSPTQVATVPLSAAALVASGQSKDEIYRAIREAYDVADPDGASGR